LIAVLTSAIGSSAAQGALVDASCTAPQTGSVNGGTDDRAAQTFTAINTGKVVRAQILINNTGSAGDFLVQILATDISRVPVNTVLGSTTVPTASVPLGASTLDATFSSPASVIGHGTYALAISRPGGSAYDLAENGTNPCSGQEFSSSTQTAPWTPDDPAFDNLFQIFVNPNNDFTVGRQTGRRLHLILPSHGSVKFAEANRAGTKAVAARKRPRVLKRIAAQIGPGGTTVRLALTKAGKRILRMRGKLGAVGSVTFIPDGGDPNTKLVLLKFTQH